MVILFMLAVKAEKDHQQFVQGIENFDKLGLQRTQLNEKNILPNEQSKLAWWPVWLSW